MPAQQSFPSLQKTYLYLIILWICLLIVKNTKINQ
jgi:hypothetical protein